jgi:hypothetical protein
MSDRFICSLHINILGWIKLSGELGVLKNRLGPRRLAELHKKLKDFEKNPKNSFVSYCLRSDFFQQVFFLKYPKKFPKILKSS